MGVQRRPCRPLMAPTMLEASARTASPSDRTGIVPSTLPSRMFLVHSRVLVVVEGQELGPQCFFPPSACPLSPLPQDCS